MNTEQTVSAGEWVMRFLVAIEQTGQHAPTETMQTVIDYQNELVACLKETTFVVETLAHLQGKEQLLLPLADRARALIAKSV